MVEELLRHGGSAGAARKRGWRCLTEEALAAYVDRNLNEGETARVEAHIADCCFCREQAAFLATAPEATVQAEVSPHLLARAEALVGGQRAAVNPGWRWAASLAAAGCVLLLVTFQLRDRPLELVFPPPAPPSMEQPPAGGSANSPAPTVDRGERQVRNSVPALTIPEIVRPVTGQGPMSDLRFEWKAVSGSLFYEVRVTTAAGDPVWQSERISATVVQPPPSIPLLPGDKYFVWVVAHLPEGKTVRSRAVAFTVLN